MATEHEEWVDWARRSAEAEIRDLRVEWRSAIARAERAEAALKVMTEQKEYFRVCWEAAEEALRAVTERAEVADIALINLERGGEVHA